MMQTKQDIIVNFTAGTKPN